MIRWIASWKNVIGSDVSLLSRNLRNQHMIHLCSFYSAWSPALPDRGASAWILSKDNVEQNRIWPGSTHDPAIYYYTLTKHVFIYSQTFTRIFKATLFIVARKLKFLKHTSTIEGINKFWYSHAMECSTTMRICSVQFSRSVVSNSLWPHALQCARSPCPSPTPGLYSNSGPLSQWWHPTISSSVIPFSSCLQSFPASGSFPMSQFFISDG